MTKIINSGKYDQIYADWFNGSSYLVDDTNSNTATTWPIPSFGGTLSNIIANGEIVFGSDINYPPFESYNATGYAVGFDVDIGNAIANEFSIAYCCHHALTK